MYGLFYRLAVIGVFAGSFIQSIQTDGKVVGQVTTENQSSLEGAQIVLKSCKDSLVVKTAISNKDGRFVLKHLISGRYIIQVSMVGYQKEARTVFFNGEGSLLIDPFRLKIEIQQLGDIVVTARRTPVEVSADKTVINLSTFNLGSGGNVFTVMQNLPGVRISNDGTVSLNGKGQAKIMINGKLSYIEGMELMSFLKSTPASSLDKIELITDPSVKYDASGNSGIINIKTKHDRPMGSSMTFYSDYEQGKNGRINNNVSVSKRCGSFNFHSMCGYYFGKDFNELYIYRMFNDNNTAFGQNSHRFRTDHNFYYNANISYDVSRKTVFEWYVDGYSSKRSEDGNIHSGFYSSKVDSTLFSSTDNLYKRSNVRTGLNMNYMIDSIGKKLNVSVDYLHYSLKEDQFHNDLFNVTGSSPSQESISKGYKDGKIKILSLQSDIICPYTEKFSLEGGIKATFVKVDNLSEYYNKSGNDWLPDNSLSSAFRYNESINAGYLDAKLSVRKMNIETGFRVEYTDVVEHQYDIGGKEDYSYRKSYINIFPSLCLRYNLSDMHSVNFIYNRRIDRPNYRDLNPFIYIFDAYTYEQGNISLKPQFSNNFNVSYIFRKNYSLHLFYSTTVDAIIKSYKTIGDSKRIYVMPMNMSGNKSYGVRVQIGRLALLKHFNTSIYSAVVRNDYRWIEDDVFKENNRTTFLFNLNNRIDFGKDWSAELSGFYNYRMAFGQITLAPMWKISMAIQKDFLQKKATITLYSNDLFNSYVTKATGVFCGTLAKTRERDVDRCIIGISFVYRLKRGNATKNFKNKEDVFDSKRVNL